MRLIKSKQFASVDCQLPIRRSKIITRKSSILICWVAVLLLGTLPGGCSTVSPGGGAQQRFSYQQTLSAPYDQTQIKRSMTLDVLPKMQRSQAELGDDSTGTELLSHSESVVASLGQSKNGYETWFNMVSFHEYRLNVIRKYFFLVHDKAGSFQTRSKRGLRFDCEMVLDKQELEKPYAAESARQIALLRAVLNNFREDINELSADTNAPGQSNEMLNVCGMLVNQTFETILLKLDSSPILATRLGQTGGFEFDHLNFDLGKIQMTVEGDIITVQIRLGAFADIT